MSIRWRARKGTDKDFCDLHAWAEIYVPGAGWVGFDVTSGLLCGEGHIPLAATPHYQSAAPITGTVDAANINFGFEMRVDRIHEAPRVTKPFSDETWVKLDALGERVDKDLKANDVRLTMGGEPTFVSIDDFESEEWNTAAVGPTKRALADTLIRKLRERFAPNGFLHYGQGKWYPGESLPRWAFALYWRKDGQPIWGDPALIAREAGPRDAAIEQAEKFTGDFADRLGVGAEFALPAFEDPAVWALKEGELPENVDPTDPKIDDPETRARMVRTFERGLSKPSGFVLPIQAWQSQSTDRRWKSEKWKLRRGKLFLVPGDSPVGFRLPLGALPWVPRSDYPYVHPQDPTELRRAAAVSANNWRSSITMVAARPKPMPIARPGSSRSRSRVPCAPRFRSSRVTASCACSCRRWSGSRIISNCWPRSRKARARPVRRFISRAIRRRTIRG